jgi:hypothetical protein
VLHHDVGRLAAGLSALLVLFAVLFAVLHG